MKTVSLLLIFILISSASFSAYADASPEIMELASDSVSYSAALLPVLARGATYTERAAIKTGPLLLLGFGLEAVLALDPYRATPEDNLKIERYFEALWGKFLNDSFYMTPNAQNPNTNYVRDVFNLATQKVNTVIAQTSLNCGTAEEKHPCSINSSRVYLSESYIPVYEIYGGKAYFFIPATDFFSGTLEEKVNKVALDIAGQIGLLEFRSQVLDIQYSHNNTGEHIPWYSLAKPLTQEKAAKIWGAQFLKLSPPEIVKSEFQIFEEEYKKYDEESHFRQPYYQTPTSLSDFEKHSTSIRKQLETTVDGPATGIPAMTLCSQKTGLELVIIREIPKCVTVYIKDIATADVQKYLQEAVEHVHTKVRYAQAGKIVAEGVSGTVMALFAQALVGRAIKSVPGGGFFAKKIASLPAAGVGAAMARKALGIPEAAIKFIIAPGVGLYVGEESVSLIVNRGSNDGLHIAKANYDDFEKALVALQTSGTFLSETDLDNQYTHYTQEQLSKVFQTNDPAVIEVLTHLAR